MKAPDPRKVMPIIDTALKEDMGTGDITTDAVIPKRLKARAFLIAQGEGVMCGLKVAELVFKRLDPSSKFKPLVIDGDTIKKGQKLAEIRGNARALLSGERTVLNFLQRMSGIASITRKCMELAKSHGVKILDTRKTTPGLRVLEKYAVRCGGGENHRMGLYDMVLVKDNHIRLSGSVKSALENARKANPGKKIEIEAENLKQVEEALEFKPDMIMLDNMTLEEMKKAVEMIGSKAKTEASGGITLSNLEGAAKTGVDFISVGCLTHSYKSLDIRMEMKRDNP